MAGKNRKDEPDPRAAEAPGAPAVRARRGFSWRKGLLFSLVPVFAVMGAFEFAARIAEIWMPPQKTDIGLGFDPSSRVFVPSESKPGVRVTNPAKEIAFHRQEFADPKTSGTLRIIAIGESSVNRLDGEFRLLEPRLKAHLGRPVEVINAGGRSYGSQRLAPVTAEIVQYQPDVVMIYMGHNEFEEVEQLRLASLETTGLQRALSHSAAFRFLRDQLSAAWVAKLRQEHNARILARSKPDVARAWRYHFTKRDVDERMAAFRANLDTMIGRCREKGIPVILGTVPSNLVRPYLPEDEYRKYVDVWMLLDRQEYAAAAERGREILREATGRHQSSPRENEIIRALAKERGITLADVEEAVTDAEPHHVPGETLFSDHCHLNEKGNKLLIEVYERAIRELLKRDSTAGRQPQNGIL